MVTVYPWKLLSPKQISAHCQVRSATARFSHACAETARSPTASTAHCLKLFPHAILFESTDSLLVRESVDVAAYKRPQKPFGKSSVFRFGCCCCHTVPACDFGIRLVASLSPFKIRLSIISVRPSDLLGFRWRPQIGPGRAVLTRPAQ